MTPETQAALDELHGAAREQAYQATIANPLEFRGVAPIQVDEIAPEDVRHWSVTEILKAVGEAGGLVHWSAQETARAAVRQRETWMAMEREDSTAAAEDWLANSRYRKPKGQLSDSAFGNELHELLASWALTGVRPEVTLERFGVPADVDNATKCLEQFDRWLDDFQPEYLATEAAVFSPTYGYAGTMDAIFIVDGVRFICDYKSSRKSVDTKGKDRKPYADSVALQLAAYAKAELLATWRARRFEKTYKRYYYLNEDERAMGVPVPPVDAGLAIHITPEHCNAYPFGKLDEAHFYFLHALEIARWVFEDSKTAMGDVLTPRAREAVA